MRKQWKKEIYIAKKEKDKDGQDVIDKYGKVRYLKPKKYLFNVQPLNGSTDIMGYGQDAQQIQRATINFEKYFGIFEVDDLAYLDGVTPKDETNNGERANYRIDAVLNQNKIIAIYFEKLTEK